MSVPAVSSAAAETLINRQLPRVDPFQIEHATSHAVT